jgi:hypothetical protein
MIGSVPFEGHCYSRGFAEQGSIAYVLHSRRLSPRVARSLQENRSTASLIWLLAGASGSTGPVTMPAAASALKHSARSKPGWFATP